MKHNVCLSVCRKCAGQFVGRTTNWLAIRHSSQKQRIKQGQEGIGEHYHVCGLDNFSVQVIDQVRDWESLDNEVVVRRLDKLEEKRQHQLTVFEENGGRKRKSRKVVLYISLIVIQPL